MNRRKDRKERKREPMFSRLFVISAFSRGQIELNTNESPQKNAKTAKESHSFYTSL